jgi:preprotein translocase subunit SecG
MAILNAVLMVLFVIVAILLILLVLVQNEDGDSLGGVFAGGGGSAFGSRSGNVLTRASSVLGGLFLTLAFVMALLTRSPQGGGVEAAGRALAPEETSSSAWWDENEAATATDETAVPPEAVDTGAETSDGEAEIPALDAAASSATSSDAAASVLPETVQTDEAVETAGQE